MPAQEPRQSKPAAVDSSLVLAERHVAKAHRMIAKQRASIERLHEAGCNSLDAEQTLDVFESSLRLFEHHRGWLRQRIG